MTGGKRHLFKINWEAKRDELQAEKNTAIKQSQLLTQKYYKCIQIIVIILRINLFSPVNRLFLPV